MTNCKKETLPYSKAQEGTDLHKLFLQGISLWNFTEFTKVTGNNPLPVFEKYKTWEKEIEQKLTWVIEEQELVGIPDLVLSDPDNRCHILLIDCKKSPDDPYYCRIMDYHTKQLQYYALALLKKNPMLTIDTAIYFLNANKLDLDSTYKSEDIDRFEHTIKKDIKKGLQARDKAEKGEELYTTIGEHCNWCNYSPSCTTPILQEPIEAQEMLKEYVKTEAKLEQLGKLLKAYNLANGEIIADGKRAGFYPTNKTVIEEQQLIECCQENNIPLESMLKLGITEVRKMAKQHKILQSFIFTEPAEPKWQVKNIKGEK